MNRPTSFHPSLIGFQNAFKDMSYPTEEYEVRTFSEYEVPRRAPNSYPSRSERSGSSSACCILIIAVVVLLLIYFLRNYVIPAVRRHERDDVASAMRGIGVSKAAQDRFVKVDVALVKRATSCDATKKQCLHILTPCTTSECENYKDMTKEAKEANDTAVRNFVAQNPRLVLMVFAPWCTHCHTAMPAFFEAACDSDVPFGLVNAELVNPDVIAGATRICDVKYFPTIVLLEHTGDELQQTHLSQAFTKENILKLSQEATPSLGF